MDFYEAQAPLIVAGVFIFVGVLSQLIYLRRKKRCTERADGVVTGFDIKNEYSRDEAIEERSAASTQYSPICRYEAGTNTVTAKCIYYFGRRKYKEGQSVVVFYDPDNVERFYIKGAVHISKFSVVMLVIGVGLVVVGIAVGLNII